ncbi:hypothetical protein [Tessaracoccus flavescens]|uniref:hypothetical protein n=1 Tax=Tessaracoccus flavescens TaxID=399497 RepID=UPI001930E50F|nr:hypothetical protein [Tessaracoccus flavescens]
MVTLGADDAGEIMTLQRAAYVTEAILHDDLALPPLTQTLDERSDELADPAVTALGRLVVAPDLQGRGSAHGSRALSKNTCPGRSRRSSSSRVGGANLRLYARLDYAETHRRPGGAYSLVFMSEARRARH